MNNSWNSRNSWQRWALALLVLLAAAAMVRLGFWQWGRYQQRQAENALMAARLAEPPLTLDEAVVEPAGLEHRRVRVAGAWDFAGEIVLRDQPGAHIITPLRVAGTGVAVLVDRGWIPDAAARQSYQTGATASIEGVALRTQAAGQLAPTAKWAEAWTRVDIDAIQRELGYPLLPVWVVQLPAPGAPALPLRGPSPPADAAKHLGYAIQWWSFAAILLAGYGVARLRRQRGAPPTMAAR